MVAEAFDGFLRKVVQATEPWISIDIDKGKRWDAEIAASLNEAKAGIICLTSDNLSSPWLLFEAGAIAKAVDPNVCTFLLDISAEQVKLPLGSFQHTRFDRDDVFKLVKRVNQILGEQGVKEVDAKTLEELFDDTWPKFETTLAKARDTQPAAKPAQRGPEELITEVLETVRSIDREVQDLSARSRNRQGWGLQKPARTLLDPPADEDSSASHSAILQGLTKNPFVDYVNHAQVKALMDSDSPESKAFFSFMESKKQMDRALKVAMRPKTPPTNTSDGGDEK